MPLQIRRGTNAQRQAMTQALAQGELLYVTDDQRLYIGNGSTLGGIQITGYTNEDAQDAAAQLFANGAPHTGITFSYNDAGAGITAVVDLLNNTGTIGGVFKGNVVAEDSTLLIDAASGQIVGPVFANVTGNVTGNLTGNASSATATSTLNITDTNGLTTVYYPTFVENRTTNQIVRADVDLSYRTDSNTLTVPNIAGNLTGTVTGNSTGFHTGDIKGSVFADDSSLMVDGIIGQVVGNINNAQTTTQTIFGATIELSGVNNNGVRAGIQIDTDGTGEDAYSLFAISGRNDSQFGQSIVFERGRGTHAVPAGLQNGDDVSELVWLGLNNVATTKLVAAIRVSVSGAVTANVPGKIAIGTVDAGSGDFKSGLSIDSIQMLDVANNTVAANSGSGTANVSGGVVSYLKIKVEGVERAIPLYGIVP